MVLGVCMITHSFLHRIILQSLLVACGTFVLFSLPVQLNAQAPVLGSDSSLSILSFAKFNARLSDLINETIEQNHSLKAAESRIIEAGAAARRVAALDPPTFGVEAMDAPLSSFPNPFKDQMEMDYSVRQMFMFPGKRRSMKQAETYKKKMAEFNKTTIEQDLVKKVKELFFDVYLADRQIEINQSAQDLVSAIIDIVRTQYEVGMGRQADILRAQTELSVLKNRMSGLAKRRTSMVAMINALADRPMSSPIEYIEEIAAPAISIDSLSMIDLALTNSPEIKSMEADLAMKRAEQRVANLAWGPDFMIKVTYKNKLFSAMSADSQSSKSPDGWGLMLEVPISAAPWAWGKSSGENKQAHAAINSAQEELAQMRNMVAASVADALAEIESIQTQMHLTSSTLLPQAQQAYQSAMATYRTGGQEFFMVLDAAKMQLMARDDYQMLVMGYLSALAKLERATGTRLLPYKGEFR